MDQSQEIKDIFYEEAQDLIERVRRQLDAGSGTDVNDIFRAVHTIKGGAATCEMPALKEAAHELETWMQPLRNGTEELSDARREMLRKSMDRFESLLDGKDDAAPLDVAEAPAFGLFVDQDVDDAATAPVVKRTEARPQAEVLRVPVDRVQENCEIVSEVFLARNQLCYLVEQFRQGSLAKDEFFQRWEVLDGGLRKSVNELEAVAMSMRMMPVRSLLRRMEKTVRSYLESSSGKDIRFDVFGEDIELDKAVLDSLAEPLIHLTRNAMDHGVESKEERRKAGKPGQARIVLCVAIEGNEVVIDVKDDGRGIDDQKIVAAARSKGLDVAQVRTKFDALDLIFLPGFSTAKSVTDVSGRGIGMDAVKTYAEAAGGSVTIHTELGAGSTFTLRLPLAISVVHTVLAVANGQKFAISSADLVETRRVSYKDVIQNGGRSFYLRNGECIPCFDVEQFLYRNHRPADPPERREYSLCVVQSKGETVAMCVPELLGNAEIAVKSLSDAAVNAPYVSGVAILATGEPTFVVSLSRLYDRVIRTSCESIAQEASRVAA